MPSGFIKIVVYISNVNCPISGQEFKSSSTPYFNRLLNVNNILLINFIDEQTKHDPFVNPLVKFHRKINRYILFAERSSLALLYNEFFGASSAITFQFIPNLSVTAAWNTL